MVDSMWLAHGSGVVVLGLPKMLVKNASVPVTVRGITARGGASFVHGLADWAFRF